MKGGGGVQVPEEEWTRGKDGRVSKDGVEGEEKEKEVIKRTDGWGGGGGVGGRDPLPTISSQLTCYQQ